MATESGGLSKEEFLLIQEQLLQLRNDNYELREELKKKSHVQNSPKNEALQFASKLINRAASSSKKDEKDAEIDGLRRKLETQEEEFKLQQETLFEEMKSLSSQNEQLKTQISSYSDHPLEKEARGSSFVDASELEAEIKLLKKEKELLCQETVPALNKKITNLTEQLENCRTLNVELEDRVLTLTAEVETIHSEKKVLDEENRRVMKEIEALREENLKIVEEIELRNRGVLEENQKLTDEKTRILEESFEQNEQLKKQIEAMKLEFIAENEQKDQKLKKTQEEVKRLEAKLEKEQEDLKLKLETATEEKKAAEEANSRLQESLNAKNLEIKQLTIQNQANLEKMTIFEVEKAESLESHKNETFKLKAENAILQAKIEELSSKIEEISAESLQNQEKAVEDRVLLLETRYQLEVDDQKKAFETEREQFQLCIVRLEEKLKSNEEEKKIAMKKHQALVKELQKTLKEERKRADSYERKSEERAGWHVVQQDVDRNSSHTFDGNESVSSLSAIESENVELITRLATLQKIHSENADTILQLESENSRLRREVTEKGELIENLIREKPLGFGNPHSPSFAGHPKLEVSFRKLLNTLSQDSNSSDVKEMNKKLQRMLEETLSKNIILQRDLQTLMERTGL